MIMDKFGQSQKIVIVEDNASLAEIYQTRMEILGYEVKVAYDGVAALNLIKEELPDLVLLDLMVPKIAGDQILETMRKSDWGRDIPVFIISNLNESDAPSGLRGMGIEGYAVKANLSNDQLDELVDKILRPASQNDSETLESPVAPSLALSSDTANTPLEPDAEAFSPPATSELSEVPSIELAPVQNTTNAEPTVTTQAPSEQVESMPSAEVNIQHPNEEQTNSEF